MHGFARGTTADELDAAVDLVGQVMAAPNEPSWFAHAPKESADAKGVSKCEPGNRPAC